MAELTVLGIGNILMSDEGVGVRLLEAVRDSRAWPPAIEFIDGGAGGLGLLNVIENARRLIAFDAADMRLPAGRCRVIGPEQAADEPADHFVSMHDVPFVQTLKLCRQFGGGPELVRMLVIQPKTVQFGRQLSPELTEAFPRLLASGVKLVLDTAGMAGLAV